MNKYDTNTTNDMRILQIEKEKGVVVLLTLLILSGILVVTLAAADLVAAGVKMNRQSGYSGLAFFAAEAGLERTLWEIRQNNYPLPSGSEKTTLFEDVHLFNSSSYKVDFERRGGDVVLTSTGKYLEVQRAVEAAYEE
jgi:hypothetical protein